VVFSIPTVFTPKVFVCFTKPKSGTFVKGCWISLFSLFLLGTAYGQDIEQNSQQDLIQFQISQLDAGNALNEFAKQYVSITVAIQSFPQVIILRRLRRK
jgi:hypothetical protein